MAAFSSTSFQQHHPFLLDSVFLPTSPSPSPSTTDTKNIMPPMMSPPFLHHFANHSFNQQNLINQDLVDNDASVVNKNSMDNSSSIVTDKHNKKRKCKAATSANSAQSKDKREVKGKKQKKIKDDEEEEKNNSKEENKADYIHVRARRGQATDSHSLAERVRRERISERMKLLQALVPGCDKLHVVLCDKQVTGKALMLDEIINYVQSLQNQVEFLSMKLASVNPMFYDFGVDLESFMFRPDQDLSEFPSPMTSMQECSPTTGSSYNFLDNNLFLLQQAQLPNDLPQPQGSRQSLWEVDEHRQRIMNEAGFNNSLFSFH